MAEAAASAGLDPDRLSSMRSIHVIRRQVTDQAAFSPQTAQQRKDDGHRGNPKESLKAAASEPIPRVIKKYIGRTYPVKQPGQAGYAFEPVILSRAG